jgi:hypothetical protein
MSKYEPLRVYLQGRATETVPMSFEEIEAVLGFPLPKSQMYAAWWSNNPTNNVMTNEWLTAGYRTEQVDLEGRKLVFRRAEEGATVKPAQAPPSSEPQGGEPTRGRHPIIGFMKGMITIAPDVDLTAPADPEWGDLAWGDAATAGKSR